METAAEAVAETLPLLTLVALRNEYRRSGSGVTGLLSASCEIVLRGTTLGYSSARRTPMIRRLTLGFALSLLTAPALFAAGTLPSQATDRLPWAHLVAQASTALCTWLGVGCV